MSDKHAGFRDVYRMNTADALGMLLVPDAIVNQEKRGQAALVRGQHLPKQLHGTTWEALKAAWGVEVMGDVDDLFYEVRLPAGWQLKRTDHDMWSHLYDDKGRERASIFYKAAFYDRSAHMGLSRRYRVHTRYEDYGKSNKKRVVEILDCGQAIHEVGTVAKNGTGNDAFMKAYDATEQLQKDGATWLTEKHPNWQDPFAYWD